MTMLDVNFVRSQFPAFSHPDSRNWIHLENAGGSYVPWQVIDLLTHFYTATKVQPYGPAGPAQAAGDAMDRAKALLPATMHASPEDVHVGPSTSQNTYVLANALRSIMAEGDEIIVTNQDHEANIGPWRRLAETGLSVREWSVDTEIDAQTAVGVPTAVGVLDLAELERNLNDRTKLVCVTHASNLAATLNPIQTIADLVHEAGALLVVDGVSWAPHGSVDVGAIGCDFYLYSTYKTYGPHLGLMYARAEVAERMANQGHYFNEGNPNARLTPAGPNHAAIGASAGIIDYYEELYRHHFEDQDRPTERHRTTQQADHPDLAQRIDAVFELVAAHEEQLMAPLLDFLATKPIRLLGTPEASRDHRAPTIAFTSEKSSPSEIAQTLAAQEIGIGCGDFYARRLVEAVGAPDGVVRISMVHYNTVEEVERTIQALDPLL